MMMLAAWISTNPQTGNLRLFDVELIGVSKLTGQQLLMTLILVVMLFLLSRAIKGIIQWISAEWKNKRAVFWVRQVINVILAIVFIIGTVSIWMRDTTHLATFFGLVTAGIAFALQQVITALAGYIVILRGRTFTVGDRIVMGGVRGDVIALGFIQTTIMEMGEPPPVQSAEPAMWVHARQYTGRIVTISNSKIFTEPVYNYTREFPYIWDEMRIPITYTADRQRAERIMLDAAAHHAVNADELDDAAVRELRRRYGMELHDMAPKVYFRLTDNWLELAVRIIVREHGVREVKDAMSREIIGAFDAAGIGIASATYDVVGMPPINVRLEDGKRQA